jgi:hypothetical protein
MILKILIVLIESITFGLVTIGTVTFNYSFVEPTYYEAKTTLKDYAMFVNFQEDLPVGIPDYVSRIEVPFSIDTPIASLNNLTLSEVFENGNLVVTPFIDTNNNNIADGLLIGNNVSTYSFSQGVQSFIGPDITGTYQNGFYIRTIENDIYYMNVEIKRNNDVSTNNLQFIYSVGSRVVTTNYINYSYKTSVAGNDHRLYIAQGQSGLSISFKNMYFINQSALGISALTVEQMDDYYAMYSDFLDGTMDELTYFTADFVPSNFTLLDLFFSLFFGFLWIMLAKVLLHIINIRRYI